MSLSISARVLVYLDMELLESCAYAVSIQKWKRTYETKSYDMNLSHVTLQVVFSADVSKLVQTLVA